MINEDVVKEIKEMRSLKAFGRRN